MKKLLGININTSLAKKGMIIALALAVVIGMSYFSSQDYLNVSIMDMLVGGTWGWPDPEALGDAELKNKSYSSISTIIQAGDLNDQRIADTYGGKLENWCKQRGKTSLQDPDDMCQENDAWIHWYKNSVDFDPPKKAGYKFKEWAD